MILGDFGTSYSKFLDLSSSAPEPYIIQSKELAAGHRVAMATGHNGKRFSDRYVNELTVLARGGESLIVEKNFVLLDCGSRDIKYFPFLCAFLLIFCGPICKLKCFFSFFLFVLSASFRALCLVQ